jgi:hypothetical protein
MKIVIQKKNKKWFLGTWDEKNLVFTREKTYVKINGSGIKKEKLPIDIYEVVITSGPRGIIQAYAVKEEEVVKKRGRKPSPNAKPQKEDFITDENLSDGKKEKAFEKTWWKAKNPLCLKCKKSCKQSAMISLYCPVMEKI